MSEATALVQIGRHRPGAPQARLIAQRPDVRSPSPSLPDMYSHTRRPDIFDEYTRRQFVAKAPTRNPFGEEEIPNKFDDFDVFTKIRVLQQLSLWTLNNPNTIRERLNPTEAEQADWVSDVCKLLCSRLT